MLQFESLKPLDICWL